MEKQNLPVKDTLQEYISEGTPSEVVQRYQRLAKRVQEADYGELDRDIVVVDTETTGVSFVHDELTQIAAARMEKGHISDWFITFVNPGKPIPDDVAHLTNIYDEDVANAPTPDEALARLVDFVGQSKIVAHNATFDKTFTTRHPSGYPLLENLWFDSLDLARIALPRLKSHRLIDIVKAFGAPLSTHRADADVEATCAAFRILLAGVENMPPELVSYIAHMGSEDEWPTRAVFEFFDHRNQEKAAPLSLRQIRSQRLAGVSFSRPSSPKALKNKAKNSPEPWDAKCENKPEQNCDLVQSCNSRNHDFIQDCNLSSASDLKQDEVPEAFSEGGLVSSLYQSFESRDEQKKMASAVYQAFKEEENLVVEAGTGVGKSMAYLVPSVLLAKHRQLSVGIATKTNTLLDQLVYQEIPALSAALEKSGETQTLSYASLKGFSHYPCLRKVQQRINLGPQMREVQGELKTQAPSLAALLSYIEQTEYDDMDGLKIDYRVLPRFLITTTSHDCLRRKCPFFGKSCFVHGARRRAEEADIVVTNHSLLFCDLAAEGGLLPPVNYWVIDEAHNAEEEARRAFSVSLAAEEILKLAAKFDSSEDSSALFSRTERRTLAHISEEGAALFHALLSKARSSSAPFVLFARDFCAHMKDLLYFSTGTKSRGYEYVDVWINSEVRASSHFSELGALAASTAEAAEKLVTALQNLVAYLEDIEDIAEIQRELASCALRLKDLIAAIELIFKCAPEGFVYSATLCKKKDKLVEKIEAQMLSVGQAMNETLYAKTKSVVFTSATLAIGNNFTTFQEALGLSESGHRPCKSLQLASSYDFDNNMVVYVISDMPEPNDPHYMGALQHLLIETHRAQQGSMLTLFTNRREMEKCFEVVQSELKKDQLRLVCQKWGVSVKGLRDDFLADEHLSLFALKSFWEGFDAPGATLKGVVIPKLPFSKPTDPLSCERAARDDQAWRHYVLPKAVIEVKQAAGRLIRRADDTGVLILADKRLITKSYGKTFLNSLPSHTVRVRTAAEVAKALALLR